MTEDEKEEEIRKYIISATSQHYHEILNKMTDRNEDFSDKDDVCIIPLLHDSNDVQYMDMDNDGFEENQDVQENYHGCSSDDYNLKLPVIDIISPSPPRSMNRSKISNRSFSSLVARSNNKSEFNHNSNNKNTNDKGNKNYSNDNNNNINNFNNSNNNYYNNKNNSSNNKNNNNNNNNNNINNSSNSTLKECQ